MRLRLSLTVVVALSVLVASAARAEGPAENVDAAKIAQMIVQLGGNDFKERQEAAQALEALGSTALDALQEATRNEDPEIARRSLDLLQKIEAHIETAQILAPERVHLVYRDMPVADAVADFKKKTGLPVELGGDKSKLTSRKINLDTGDTTAWEALAQLCQSAGLMEHEPFPPNEKDNPPGVNSQGIERQARLRVKIRMQQVMIREGLPSGGMGTIPITLVDGQSPPVPTYQAGAVRIRSVRTESLMSARSSGDGETVLGLEVIPEPTIQWQQVIDIKIDKAVDDQGQQQSQFILFAGFGNLDFNPSLLGDPRVLPIHLKGLSSEAKTIKELEGSMAVQVQTPLRPLVTVDNVLQAVGRTVTNSAGESLKVVDIHTQPDGLIKIRAQLEGQNLPMNATVIRGVGAVRGGGGVVMVQAGGPGALQPGSLSLVNDKGQSFRLVSQEHNIRVSNANRLAEEITVTFKAQGPGEASKLVLSGPRTVVIEVPFTLKDIPLS